MREQNNIHNAADVQGQQDADDRYCKLFADRIDREVCVIRKQELNTKEGFSCSGCDNESNEETSA